MTSKIIESHIMPPLCQNLSSTFVHEQNMVKINMKTQFFHKMKYGLKDSFYVTERFCDLIIFYLIITLTYVTMDKF